MGYGIIYKKAFVNVNGKFIPIIQYGSNNCWECNGHRDVPEKNWGVCFYTNDGRYHNQILFDSNQIKDIALDISQPNSYGEILHKTRYRMFKQQELYNWFVNGMKLSKTIEEYISLGNNLLFTVNDYRTDDNGNYLPKDKIINVSSVISSTDELLNLIEEYKYLIHEKNICLGVKFLSRNLNLPKTRRLKKEKKAYDIAYCIKLESGYLVKKLKYGYRYTHNPTNTLLKLFKTEAQAQRYINKYPDTFKNADVAKLTGYTFYI